MKDGPAGAAAALGREDRRAQQSWSIPVWEASVALAPDDSLLVCRCYCRDDESDGTGRSWRARSIDKVSRVALLLGGNRPHRAAGGWGCRRRRIVL